MAKFTVYHVDSRPERQPHTAEEEQLAKADAQLVPLTLEQQEDIPAHVTDADGIICGYRQVGQPIFEAAPNLKVVVRYGIGFDNIDWQAATEYDIVVCNITDYCINEVATHAMSLLLALNRKLVAHDNAARVGERVPLGPSGPLYGETLGLVAFGHIAQQAAIRAQAFGLNVIAYDPYQDPAAASAAGVRLTSLEEVMAADYVSVHPPMSPETRGMIGAEQLAQMKPSAYLITTCRGGVVNEQALYDALKNGRIAGAGVDVWDPEPVHKDHPLLEFDNVIATPHSAYYSDASGPLLLERVGEAAADVLRGYLPRSVVNKAVLDKVSLAPHPER